MSKFVILAVLLLLVALNFASALRCNLDAGDGDGQLRMAQVKENNDGDDGDWFQARANSMRNLAMRHMMPKGMAPNKDDDNQNANEDPVECSEEENYCITLVCGTFSYHGCTNLKEGLTPKEVCDMYKSCKVCKICQEDGCN